MLERIFAILLWHRELALVPMVVGALMPAIFCSLWFRTGSRVFGGAVTCMLALIACYVGWTSLLDSVEAADIVAPGSLIALLGAFGLFSIGVLFAAVLYGWMLPVEDPTIVRVEDSYNEFVDPIHD